MIAGIVCEYNPLHKGHVYLIEKARSAGADFVVCVMSGNFVQRGECALMDKWSRAEAAVRSGADVVIDLPVPWAVSSGENFARGGVFLLSAFGVDTVFFGSEYEDKNELLLAAGCTGNEDVMMTVRQLMSEGFSYPSALSRAVSEHYGEKTAEIISSPNSTLGVEYIRQLERLGGMDFYPVKRKGAAHDSNEECDFASASKIREDILSGKAVASYLNEATEKILSREISLSQAPCLMENNERAVLCALRSMSKEELSLYISDSQGLVSRIYDSVREAESLTELYDKVKSKNYTHSRIRREVLNAYLDIEKDIATENPPYIRLLACNERGLTLLSRAKKNSALPIVTRHGEMQKLSDFSKRIYELQCSSTDKFALFSERIRPCGLEQTNPMLIIK